MSISYSALCGDYFAATDKRTETLALEALHGFVVAFEGTEEKDKHKGAMSRSMAGENITLSYSVANDTGLNRTVDTVKRNQSFSLSRSSNRVKLSMVDPTLLSVRSPAGKLAKAQEYKRQNNRTPFDAKERIERKIAELLHKLEKAIRQGKDTTAIDALLIRCQYYRHREVVRLAELSVKADERDEAKATLMKPANEVPVFDRPLMPASTGRTYKMGRKVLKDRIVRHGPADPGKIAIKGRSKSRKMDKVAALKRELKRIAKAKENKPLERYYPLLDLKVGGTK